MDTVLQQPMTLAAFLDWERAQERPWEFDGWGPVAMNGGTVAHSKIASNLFVALRSLLEGTACQTLRTDLKILVDGRVRYPDGVVTCSPVPDDADIVPEPVAVFEVMSASTSRTDRVLKNNEYRRTSSIQHYVMFEQDDIAATIFSRQGDDWAGHLLGDGDALDLCAIGVTVPLRACYAGLEIAGR